MRVSSDARDVRLLRLALAEARKSRGHACGQFSVGAVVARGDDVLATGYTQELGGRMHAEECALAKLGDDVDTAQCDLYVTMQPCTARASSPTTCTELVVRARFRRVVLGTYEPPDYVVAGEPDALERADIDVVHVAALADECLAVARGETAAAPS